MAEGGNSFARPFAIVECAWMEMGKVWFHLRRMEGGLSESEHDESLRRGKKIDQAHLIELISRWRFMESEPPLMYMLLHIFDHILPLYAAETEFDREKGARYPVVEVSAADVRDKLEEQFCPTYTDPRQFRLPKIDWVKNALEALVRIGIASRMPSVADRYRIELKRPLRKDLLEYFTTKLAALEEKEQVTAKPGQAELLPPVNGS